MTWRGIMASELPGISTRNMWNPVQATPWPTEIVVYLPQHPSVPHATSLPLTLPHTRATPKLSSPPASKSTSPTYSPRIQGWDLWWLEIVITSSKQKYQPHVFSENTWLGFMVVGVVGCKATHCNQYLQQLQPP